jgi:hypothetical protein
MNQNKLLMKKTHGCYAYYAKRNLSVKFSRTIIYNDGSLLLIVG